VLPLSGVPVIGWLIAGTLQFVLLKPVMAALTLLLYAAGDYTDGNMSPTDG
jgi:hypothetical protein